MTDYILEAKDVSFQYEDGTRALDGVSVSIPRAKKVAILGPNGAGKSTLFLHFNGIYKPLNGKVMFEAEQIRYKSLYLKKLRKNVGIVFQDPDMQLVAANVLQEVAFGPLNLGFNQEEVYRKVISILEKINILHLKDRPTHFLSYGEKKKVAIAGVLVMEPKVVVFDEPTAGLDAASIAQLVRLLDKINNEGKTLIISTHDADFAYSWADYIIVMHKGKAVAEGKTQDIFNNRDVLESIGLELPWILEIYNKLKIKGLLRKHIFPPKTKEELINLLK